MGVRFEFQSPPLRLEGQNLVWVITNTGDTAAEPGVEINTLKVARRAEPDRYGNTPQIDTTPWQFELPVDDTVEPGTAHSASYPLDWHGLENGAYEAHVSLQQGANGVEAWLYFRMDNGWPHLDTA